jgi:AraC-like DNA-binding protein
MSVEAGGRLEWFTSVIVDRTIHRGYVVGRDERFHLYVLAVEYDKQPARLTLYETELQDSLPFSTPVLLPDGDLLMTGGVTDNNFTPFATAYRFHLGTTDDVEAEAGNGWLWLSLLFIAVLTGGAAALWLLRRKRKPQSVAVPDDSTLPDNLLLARICDLMENEKPYLNSELKVADVAEMAGTNSRNVSDCIKAARGCSFSQFVNAYRIDYAKQLLVSEPDIKVAAVALQSGFANEMSFFRTFKAITSMTPKEWKDTQVS